MKLRTAKSKSGTKYFQIFKRTVKKLGY